MAATWPLNISVEVSQTVAPSAIVAIATAGAIIVSLWLATATATSHFPQ
jgi:hypothetical protein